MEIIVAEHYRSSAARIKLLLMAGQRDISIQNGIAEGRTIIDGTLACIRSSLPGVVRAYNNAVDRLLVIHVIPEPGKNPPGVQTNNTFYTDAIAFEKNPLLIVNLKNMVDAIAGLTRRKRTLVRELIISGHGSGGGILSKAGFYIGSDWINQETIERRDNIEQFRSLTKLLLSTGMVVLHSCDVGKDGKLVQRISSLLGGIQVKASTVHQYPRTPELIGGVIVCQLVCSPYNPK